MATVTYTVNSLPAANDQTPAVCEDVAGGGTSAVDLTALNAAIDGGAGHTITWYSDAGLTTPVGDPTNETVSTGSVYYAEVDDGTCTDVATVTYTVNATPPDAANPSDNSYCEGSPTASISVDDPGAGFRIDWYDASIGGILSGTGATFTPAVQGTYWAEIVNETTSCASVNRISATLTEFPKPPALTISGNNNPACQAAAEVYSVSGLPGSTYAWTIPLGAVIVGPTDGPSITVDFGLNSGDITVTETSADGCAGDVATLNVNLQTCPFAADFFSDATEVCINEPVTFTDASSAPVGTNYTWDFGVDANPSTESTQGPHVVTYSSAGAKSITLTITNGPQTDFVTKNITVTDLPTADLSGNATICPGASASLTVNLTGTAPWIFVYNDGSTDIIENITGSPHTISVNPTSFTTYTPVSVSDSLCTGSVSGSATVDVTPPKEVAIRLDSITGAIPGSLVRVPLRVIDYEDLMTMQFTVKWDPVLLSYNSISDINLGNVSGASFGTAEVSNGFLTFSWNTAGLNDTTIVDSTAIFSIDFNLANTLCPEAYVTIDEALTALTPIEIADENLCIANVTVKGGNVENTPAVQVSSDVGNSICFGDQVIFTGLPGGMTNYQFFLNGSSVQNGANSVYLNNTLIDEDSVNVLVTDPQGCSLAGQGIVMNVNQMTITPTITDITTCGGNDGKIIINVTDGSGNYSYLWTGPGIDPGNEFLKDQSGLIRGSYNVEVEDLTTGCLESLDIELKDPVNFNVVVTKSDVTTTGGNDGSILLTIDGPGGPYEINWRGPNGFSSTGTFIEDLSAGIYIAEIEDTNDSCKDEVTVLIQQPFNAIVLNAIKTDVTTCGARNGTINLLITGGSGSFAISWTGPNMFTSNDQNLSGLEGGLYIVTVIDLVTALTAQWSVQIDEPEGFIINADVTDLTHCDAANGTITLTVTGGSGDFSYAWRDLSGLGFTSTDKDLIDLELGIYRVAVTDNVSGCIDSLDAVVGRPSICEQPCALNVESTTNNTSCPDTEDGVAVINIISGGSGPGNYYVSLDTGKTYTSFEGQDITAIIDKGQGSYLYIVKDTVTGCTDQTIANVGVSTNLLANIGVTNPGCAEDDGIITFNVSGGVVPIEVDIVDSLGNVTTRSGNGFSQFMDLTAGSYFYTVREQSGCSVVASDSIELRVDCTSGCTSLIASAHSFEDATCGSDPNGKAVIDVTGGSSPYQYSVDGNNWIPFISGNVIDQLPPDGTYNIVIRQDSANADCRAEVSVTIDGPPLMILETPIITTQKASCNLNDGAVKVGRVAGGIPPFTYQIDGSFFNLASDSIITDLSAGIHTFSVIDNVGCLADFRFTVDSPGVIAAQLTEVPVSCTSIFLKAGIMIEVDLDSTTLPGPYEAYVAPASDPQNGTVYQIPDNGIRTILNLDKDFYTVNITTGIDGGCSFSETIPVFSGAYPLDFEIIKSDSIVSCIGDIGSITIGNVIGDPDAAFIVQLISESDEILETFELHRYEFEGGFTIDRSKTDKLVAGRYYIKMIQNQKECADVESVSELITIHEPLSQLGFEVFGEMDVVSLADHPTGSITGEVIPSGGDPYEVLIQLVDPVFEMNVTDIIKFNESRDWVEVPSTGENLNRYPVTLDSLWAGLYMIDVRDAYGCEFELEHSLGYDSTIFIPNVFTPNDDGYNDSFYIRNLPDEGTKVVISNRNGSVVFESDNYTYNDLWDGGNLSDGIYFYTITTPSGASYKGWVEKWSGARP
ncbi:MAG: gliding motility-associated C-terminal domain-containing protein [Cytophagales bacterium]|nr:gliding motility-associated C-terminal domain-containing protein [Cytophagales bacterium]